MEEPGQHGGRYVRQPSGYRAFIPADLPPDPPVHTGSATVALLSRADQAIGRLDAGTQFVPNQDLFLAMYVRREAVDSSRIEGTQSSLQDVLAFELNPATRDLPQDVEEVVNYVRAMNYGLDRLATLPLSLRLIREIHAVLLQGVRGADKSPGEFRATQNWIGAGNVPLSQAIFVPPPAHEMGHALDDLESFLHHDHGLPALVHCALAHVQFETIHPFLDGNGRVGRLLIAFQLVHREVLHRPLLYLSTYLKHYRAEYYARLMAVRQEGDWEGWLQFFLRGVAETAEEATDTARAIVHLREEHYGLLRNRGAGANEVRLLDLLFQRPLVNVALVRQLLGVTNVTATRLVDQLAGDGLLDEITGKKRNRVFRYTPYWRLFQDENEGG
ncbi:MAG: Fic family protein [Thermomicrobiales bacterium]